MPQIISNEMWVPTTNELVKYVFMIYKHKHTHNSNNEISQKKRGKPKKKWVQIYVIRTYIVQGNIVDKTLTELGAWSRA